jgi:RNA polymerase sigma-70 factor (ECF subfamily)
MIDFVASVHGTDTDMRALTLASVEPEPVSRLREQDRFRTAVEGNVTSLWRFLRRMGVAEVDAEDALQAVFLVLSQRVRSVPPGAERPFLFGTALRVAADYRKRGHRRHEVAVDDDALAAEPSAGPDAEDEAEQRQRRGWLDRLLARLPEGLREVFVMAEIEEMTMPEIASVLTIPPGTVASRLRRARVVFAEEADALRREIENREAQR